MRSLEVTHGAGVCFLTNHVSDDCSPVAFINPHLKLQITQSDQSLVRESSAAPQNRDMPQRRTLTVDYNGDTTEVLYVVGTQLSINIYRSAPSRANFFSVVCSDNVKLNVKSGVPLPLKDNPVLLLSMSCASKEQGDGKVTINMLEDPKAKLTFANLLLTAVEISLDVDADQDGKVEKNNPNKASWKWGPDGFGAILLVNCDCDSGKRPDNEKSFIGTLEDLKDMAPMVLRTAGPETLPEGHRLKLHMSAHDAEAAQVFTKRFSKEQDADYPLILASGKLSREIDYTKEMTFYVSGLKFADKDFAGLVRFHVSLLQHGSPETAIFTDTVQFKMTPWIMTPNVQDPLNVYVCSTPDNKKFIDGMTTLVQKVGCYLDIIENKINRGDRWTQDEMEFGYIDAPYQSFPVVFNSPRDRELDNFPYNKLMGPDFGYVTFKPPRDEVNSLESFGNLEVSPPVTVNGKNYPLGRIVHGGAFPFQTDGRNMSSMTRNFLSAQVVQEPVVLFTDWLLVGHVDEFLSFVPTKDRKGFRLLLASPHAAYKLLQRLQEEGHGQAKFCEDVPDPTVKPVTVDELLADKVFHEKNDYYQRCIDWNRDHLKNELGLDEDDIVDIPLLYKQLDKKAISFNPNPVNMIVLGQNLGIGKPFGPKVDGQCVIEKELMSLLEPLGLKCNFINDFRSYYELDGDVHCGSNVSRKAFDLKWWKMEM